MAERAGQASDGELLQRIIKVDANAFGEFYDRHAIAASSLARWMVGDGRFEGVVQAAFLEIWHGAAGLDVHRGTPRGWLLAIVRERALAVLHGLDGDERRRIGDERHEQLPTRAPVSATPARQALTGLPAGQRRVLELIYFGGRTPAEIAGETGVSVVTVRGHAREGLESLTKRLGGEVEAADD